MDLFSPMHVLLLLAVALLIFGPSRLPEIGSGLGKSIREFKRSMNQISSDKEAPTKSAKEYPAKAVVTDENPPE